MNLKNINNKIDPDEKESKELVKLFVSGELQVAKKKAMEQLIKYPKSYVIHNILGAILAAESKFDEAIVHYKKSIEIKFDYAEAHNNLGAALQKLNNLKQAISSYNSALKYKINFAQAHNNLGAVFHKLGKFDEAINKFNQALKINSNYAEAYNNLGSTLLELGKFDEAIANHRQALKINPDYAEGYNYLGNTFAEEEKFEEAITNYRKALEINPKYTEANFNESIIRLTQGDYEMGWKKYEFRFDVSSVTSMRYNVSKVWNGNYLDGTLLIWAEQGIGDHILFLSMIADIRKHAKNIILEIDKRLVNLFKRYCEKINFSNIKVIGLGKELVNNFDKHIAIGSLGQYLRKSKESFKTTPKKYLISSPSKEKKLREKYFANKKYKIGISWKTLNKKQQHRNIDLKQMLPILSNPNCDIINLQFGKYEEDLKNFKTNYGIHIRTIEDVDNYNDIENLSALIDCLDLVISIQNSTAHLAGALGKNTWIMLVKNARWHWLMNEKKSLWYPTVTLFRQKKIGDWNSVINSIGKELVKNIN